MLFHSKLTNTDALLKVKEKVCFYYSLLKKLLLFWLLFGNLNFNMLLQSLTPFRNNETRRYNHLRQYLLHQ